MISVNTRAACSFKICSPRAFLLCVGGLFFSPQTLIHFIVLFVL